MEKLNNIKRQHIIESFVSEKQKRTQQVIDVIEKGGNLSDLFLTVNELEEIEKGRPGLVAKRVTIQMPGGKTHQAIRWVKPDTGDAQSLGHKKYDVGEHQSFSVEDTIKNIIDNEKTKSGKLKKLVGLGIYDRDTLVKLTGYSSSDIIQNVKDEVGIDITEKHPNTLLPTEKPEGTEDISSEEGQMKAISVIQSEMGDNAAFKAQKGLRDFVREKFGITVDDKWETYEENIDMLLDGSLGLRAVMGYGVGGIGKTYTFEKLAEERKLIEFDEELDMERGSDEYDYVKIGGKIGSREMQRKMFEHQNKLLVFDDCDSMWDDEGLINVLKNTLDTSGSGKCQWAQRLPETSKGAGDFVPATFSFNGRMIFITNLSKQELTAKGAAPITESRCKASDLTMNMEQTLERLSKILPHVSLKDEKREKMDDIELEDKQIALEVLKEVAPFANINQLNTRVLTGIIAKARYQRKKTGEYDKNKLLKDALTQFGY